jgi:hypothetical protein
VLADGERTLNIQHGLNKVHLHLCRIKTPPAGRVGAGGGGTGARRPRSLLLTRHARTRALAALRAAGAGARAAACRPAGAQRLVLLALLGIEFGAAAGAQEVTARARREAVQATRTALTLPKIQRIFTTRSPIHLAGHCYRLQ